MPENALHEIRQQLETIDEKIHDLLMKRADIAARLSAAAKKAGQPAVDPQAVAMHIHKLLNRHSGPMPRKTLAHIWHVLEMDVLLSQAASRIAVSVPDGAQGLTMWDMVKDYFGGSLPLHKVVNPMAALSMVKERDVAFAVLPWPENDGTQAWWRFLAEEHGASALRIVARLPFGENETDNGNPAHRALLVGRMEFSGGAMDRSFIGLQLEHRISRARIVDKAAMLGLTALSLHSAPTASPDYNDHLLEVTGFNSATDMDKLGQLVTLLESTHGCAVFVGGYAVPPLWDVNRKGGSDVSSLRKRA